jgi:GT2 family glycosyltransferase
LTGVKATSDGWLATDPEPWLRCEIPPSAGRWVRLEYASGLLDPVTRPALRFVGRGGVVHDELLPAAMLGRGVWIGRLPEDTSEIRISPQLGAGPFAFRIEGWRTLSSLRALSHFGPTETSRALKYAWGRLRGWNQFARLQARRALGPTPLGDYARWRRARARPFDPAFDSPGALAAPPLAFHVLAPNAEAATALQPMLQRQIWPHWTLGLAGERLEVGDDDYVLALNAGDRLEPHALAQLAAQASRDARPDALYADEDALDNGTRVAPRLKPDWSPLFSLGGYVGAPLAVSGAAWRAGGFDPATARVAHVRRVALSRMHPSPIAPAPPPAPIDARRQATIIVPTRDRPDLIGPCVDSLTRFSLGADFELIVIDNGSVRSDALAQLETLAELPNLRVLRRPGPFNFSAICNSGAREARHPFLVFLNDDVEALEPDWLGRMLQFAATPNVGAVGAKLFFPDGRLQHGGVVLGLDGFAGHVQRAAGADDPGYLGMLAWPREAAAVTGACLAVEARKFFEVGGFDEQRLPVEYNDIDLCLRLAQSGYKSVFEPRARLIHRESASRGANPWLDSRYAAEHAYFRERWAHLLRDDPYFHPALSLDALDIALG